MIFSYLNRFRSEAVQPSPSHITMCLAIGCTASDLKLFKYTRVKRPLYPFDLDMRLGRNEA